ncbi:unnamed protein product [Acanthoscelides obtectus]|uniref:Uridine 5'-monophosphate synthase n=1 Tax=Acanthoscelides obtectus TaxID=200917 RepID=A0A9P0LV90_ACAOB|nr:unnamed protein product [Acanthoscelides obtectus]CAK1633298.1 Uridine 5'-monophosphate synthase [Acanthoscelides obtectus]
MLSFFLILFINIVYFIYQLLTDLLQKYLEKIKNVDIICGVPYTALPIATVLSLKTNIPMVMRRKEAKDYGTKKMIEGVFKKGDNCLIIEDVVTSGSSILETVEDLTAEGIKCSDVVVFLNREQGGAEYLKHNGVNMHSLLNLTDLMRYLKEEGCIDEKTVNKVSDYLHTTQVDHEALSKSLSKDRLYLSFAERAKIAKNPIAAKLFQIMATKQTTLCLAADLTDSTALLNLAEQAGPHICALKTHIDIVDDFHPNLIKPLREIANRHNFILFEDRKFCDIGKTIELQYSKGIYKISTWAQLVTAHALLGKGVLEVIKKSEGLEKRGVFLLAEASCSGTLIDAKYAKSTMKMAEEYPELVAGIVCQSPMFLNQPGLIQLTPGVQIDNKSDDVDQQYNSPEIVVTEKGCDIAVVGRGITKAADAALAAEKYRKILWDAYLQRIKKNHK